MGIILKNYDKDKLEHFVEDRLTALKLKNTNDYFDYLTFSQNSAQEYNLLTNYLCINETSFFRNADVFYLLKDSILNEVIKNSEDNCIRILSAGCSTGAEPYSIAMLLNEYLQRNNLNYSVKILGVDIDKEALSIAENAVYNQRVVLLNNYDSQLIAKYFKIDSANNYIVSDEIKKMVSFRYLNILNAEFPVEFDMIFIKNILIYFDDEQIDRLIKKMYRMLKNRGYLFTTSTEFKLDYEEFFEIEKYYSYYYYRKWSASKRRTTDSKNINMIDKRMPVVHKDLPKTEYIDVNDKSILKISGVISYNISENKFKELLRKPLVYFASKIIIYDFKEVRYIENLYLRYISEVINDNLLKFNNRKSIYFVLPENLSEIFYKTKFKRYVEFVNSISDIQIEVKKNADYDKKQINSTPTAAVVVSQIPPPPKIEIKKIDTPNVRKNDTVKNNNVISTPNALRQKEETKKINDEIIQKTKKVLLATLSKK
ncbi:MAG TPA: protein-glutamate O-methyltransferase CheR, partial [bacterium]|nr:protein-glutamate O-methyltransferase CheR [bacterium]